MRIRHIVSAMSLAVLLTPALASAQWKITTFGGVYTPTTDVAKESATLDGTTGTGAIKHQPGFILGLNANTWVNDRAGFELSGGYAWTDQKVSAAFGTTSGSTNYSSYVALMNAKLLLRLTPPTQSTEFYAGVGPAVIFSGGSGYKANQDLGLKFDRGTDVGGVASLGFRYKIAPAMALKLGGDMYMYSTKIKINDLTDPTATYTAKSKFQTDFVFSAGLSFTLPGMAR